MTPPPEDDRPWGSPESGPVPHPTPGPGPAPDQSSFPPYGAPVADAPTYGTPTYGTPPPEHRPYAVGRSGDPGRYRRRGGNRLVLSLFPLVAVAVFLAMRGNGIGGFLVPFLVIAVLGVVSQILRRGSRRD